MILLLTILLFKYNLIVVFLIKEISYIGILISIFVNIIFPLFFIFHIDYDIKF